VLAVEIVSFSLTFAGESKIILWLCMLELVMGMELIMEMHSVFLVFINELRMYT
jgi:hypothetical protein